MFTNINIKSDKIFTYLVDYNTNSYEPSNHSAKLIKGVNGDVFIDNQNDMYFESGYWKKFNEGEIGFETIKIESMNTLKLMFPVYSDFSYDKTGLYILSVYTWLNGKRIILGNKLINRLDALASKTINRYSNTYMEYVDMEIISPEYLSTLYKYDTNNLYNRINLVLGVTLVPVEIYEDKYYIRSGYTEGCNCINISKYSDFLRLQLSHNIFDKSDDVSVICDVIYNKSMYNNIIEYIKNVYHLDFDISLKYEVVLKDLDNYNIIKSSSKQIDADKAIFDISELYVPLTDESGNNIDYTNGVSIMASLTILNKETEEQVLYLTSNEIPMSSNLSGYFIEKIIKQIDLSVVNMNIFNLNTVQKSVNKVVKMPIPESTSKTIQTIFFQAQKLANIVIHPAVTETICINLDAYKSKVSTFLLQVEGISFVEIGRTQTGVLFKIVGNQLPATAESGTYYIMDQDANVITNGKYKYDY